MGKAHPKSARKLASRIVDRATTVGVGRAAKSPSARVNHAFTAPSSSPQFHRICAPTSYVRKSTAGRKPASRTVVRVRHVAISTGVPHGEKNGVSQGVTVGLNTGSAAGHGRASAHILGAAPSSAWRDPAVPSSARHGCPAAPSRTRRGHGPAASAALSSGNRREGRPDSGREPGSRPPAGQRLMSALRASASSSTTLRPVEELRALRCADPLRDPVGVAGTAVAAACVPANKASRRASASDSTRTGADAATSGTLTETKEGSASVDGEIRSTRAGPLALGS
jgi:hypothetical protein